MRKLLSALVLLALVIVMMPTQVARADNEECNANGHDWGAWEKLNEESHRRTCKREGCGATETEAHYDRWASKCGRQPHCEKCGHDYGTIPEHEMWYEYCNEENHKPNCYHCDTYFFLEAHTGGTATCTQKKKCGKCGAEYGDKDLNNHDWGAWTPDANGTTHTRTCQRGCGATETVAHFGGTATCTEKAKCETCGAEYGGPLGHDLTDHAAKAPTCLEIGWDAYDTCSRCDYTTYVEIPALGHDLIHHDAQAATCTEIGWDAYDTCSRCDYSTYAEKAALGHDLKEMAKVEPTCTEPGTEAYWTCQRDGCGKLFSDEKGEHEIEAPVVINALGHDLKAAAKVEPICTEPGTEAYWTCLRDGCGKLFSDEKGEHEIEAPVVIKALGHDLKATAKVEPTCTEPGTEAYWTCQRDGCGKLFSDEKGEPEIDVPVVIPAKGHIAGTAVRENERAATCTSAGGYEEAVYCAACKAELSRETVLTPARGHDYSVASRTITIIRSTCGRCGEGTWTYNPKSRNLLPGLVRDGVGRPVDYTAGVSRADGKWVLTITPELNNAEEATEETRLYLAPEYVRQWLREGISAVVFKREAAALEIGLGAITPDWFAMPEDDISFYIFILAPRDQGILTDVKAMTGEAFAPANTVAGLVLKWEIIDPADGKAEVRRLEIIETGTYDLEGLPVI